MNFNIRKCMPNDAKDVQILSQQLGYSLSITETRELISQVNKYVDHIVLVAEKDEKISGWIHAFKALRIESKPFIEIGGLVVDDESRKLGIGKQLVNEIYKWAKQQDCEDLRVRCNTKRSEAHRFYNALGFMESKEQKVFIKELK